MRRINQLYETVFCGVFLALTKKFKIKERKNCGILLRKNLYLEYRYLHTLTFLFTKHLHLKAMILYIFNQLLLLDHSIVSLKLVKLVQVPIYLRLDFHPHENTQ